MMGYAIAGTVLVAFVLSLALTVGIVYFLFSALVGRDASASEVVHET
jgi:hypothetical protein